MFNFERLEVWQKSISFVGLIYDATKTFPQDERFGLTNQIRRAASSISSNIAEGSARPPADFAKFLGYATGSLYAGIHCPSTGIFGRGRLPKDLRGRRRNLTNA
jgi:hypothetical protein